MRRVIRRHIRRRADGIDLAMDVNAVVAANSGSTRVESVQSTSVTQGASARAEDERREPPADRTDNPPEEDR